MQIQINGKVSRSDALDGHVDREVNTALRHYADQITRVEVHLNDINAEKGGQDKRCLVEVRVAGQAPMVAEAIGGDLYGVISQACEKVGRVVGHHLDKLHDRR